AYIHAAARRGEKAAVFLFDERQGTYLLRAKNLGMDLTPFLEDGTVTVEQINIGDISAGELAHNLRQLVEKQGIGMVVLDSLTGFRQTLPEEPQLMAQLHEILGYLGEHGVLTLLLVTEHGMFGVTSSGDIDVSYLTDSVILLRRFEAMGRMRLAAAAIKKRHGDHDKYIRELMITAEGVVVGEPLREFSGILTGSPVFIGDTDKLME
ncbi:MAG: ATPase domain-containing protein, partial [Desulfurivibrionaceae bacterium]